MTLCPASPHMCDMCLCAIVSGNFYPWLHTTMKDDRLGNLGVLAMQGFILSLNVNK